MNSTFLLIKHLEDKLKTEFANFPFRVPNKTDEKYSEPNIFIGHTPSRKSTEQDGDIGDSQPYIIIRELEGEIADKAIGRTHEVKIGFLCCVFSKQSYDKIEEGYHDISNMRDVILKMLNNELIFADLWNLQEPVKWTTGLEKAMTDIYGAGMQDHPYYGCAVVATFWTGALEKPTINDITNMRDK